MSIMTLGDVLDRASAFEVELEQLYAAIRDRSQDNGVRLLTYYLARHRRRQQRSLVVVDPPTLQHVRKIELKFEIVFDPKQDFPLLESDPEGVKGDDLLRAAMRYDAALVELYRQILRQHLTDEAKTVLEALIRNEEKDIVMLQKMLAMHYF